MNQIENITYIDENILDQSYYFQSLLLEAVKHKLLTTSEVERIQLELVELMGKEVERYTNDESSSIPVEKAQEILQSITFNIGFYLKSFKDMAQKLEILKKSKAADMFYKGMEGVSGRTKEADQILKKIQKGLLKLNNYAYQDTILSGIPEFFHKYEIEFSAYEIPGCIDYPLFKTFTGLLGVEYIYHYLACFAIEQRFINCYCEEAIHGLMLRFDKEAEHMLFNIYELVLVNALACALLGKSSDRLEFDQEELHLLQRELETFHNLDLTKKLENAFYELKEEIGLDQEVVEYTLNVIPELAIRLQHNLKTNTLEKIFHPKVTNTEPEEIYEDGTMMEDEKLRDLIENLRECRITSDKIAIIKDTVRSQADFLELLEECFYEDEYEEVFASLSDMEKNILKKSLLLEVGPGHSEEFVPEKHWQKLLFRKD